ncbi:MAG: MFS transporter, partial [Sulfuricaulis sp.]|nr:MFS transporter [Sulfuricaulis sp.]
GGLITEYFNWRGIFLINIPIGILGLALVLRHIPNIRESEIPALDVRGFGLLGIGLSALMLGLSALGGHLLSGTATTACIAVGALALAGYGWHARSARDPVIDLSLLKYVTFRAGVVGGNLFRIGVGATPFLLPLMFQLGFGLDPFHSGLLTCTTAVGAMFVKTATVMILRRYGFRRVMTVNAILAAAGTAIYGLFTADTSLFIIIPVFILSGCLRSLQFTAISAITFAEITRQTMSQAASVQSMTQRLSQSMGVVIAAYVLQVSSDLQGHASVVTADFWPAFVVVGLISGASIFFNLGLPPDAGAEISGHGKKKTA